MLEPGQEVLVQVVKEPLGQKGARITSHVSLPGRYLVFMPTVEHVGVSRKIVDEDERRRLKTILKELRQQRGGGGLIARTVGAGHSAEDFERDMRYLSRTWDEVRAESSRQGAPALLHRELSLVQRLLRDILSDDIANIRLDSEKEFQRTLDMVNVALSPTWPRAFACTTARRPSSRSTGWRASSSAPCAPRCGWSPAATSSSTRRRRWSRSTSTPAASRGRRDLEETILKTNLEAVKEIVRQIRLRDLGGIIVVDFIDMEERKSRQKVMAALEQELKKDRSPSKMLSVNEFGLVILTRKRVKQSLERTLCQPCPYCSGSGMVKSVTTVCSEIYDEVRKLAPHFSGNAVPCASAPTSRAPSAAKRRPCSRSSARCSATTSPCRAIPLLHQEQFDVVPQ